MNRWKLHMRKLETFEIEFTYLLYKVMNTYILEVYKLSNQSSIPA